MMKDLPVFFALLALISPAAGQEKADDISGVGTASKWDVELPALQVPETPLIPVPVTEPIRFEILATNERKIFVQEPAEMQGAPPVSGMISLTIQEVADPGLTDPVPPLPALSPDDPVIAGRMEELRETYRGTSLAFLSATVYDHRRTLLRIYSGGKTGKEVAAWSNLDFNHFSGVSTYRVNDGVDGAVYETLLMMGIGNENTAALTENDPRSDMDSEAPEIPKLPDLSTGGPAFVVVEGEDGSPAMDTLEQLHDLYRKEGERMEAASHARETARAERKAFLLANPQKPEDVTIRFWKREKPSPLGLRNIEAGVKP